MPLRKHTPHMARAHAHMTVHAHSVSATNEP